MSTTTPPDTQNVSISDKANKFLTENKDLEPSLFKENLKTIEDEALRAVIMAEKKVRDTQAGFTKSQQELNQLKVRAEVLERLVTPKVEVDEATQVKLDDLMYSDPQAWRAEMNRLEEEAKVKHLASLTEAEKSVFAQQELQQRASYLEEFNRLHPEITLNDDVIKYDIPSRITSKLEKGEISFDTFVTECYTFLTKGKVVGDGNKTMDQPNLSKQGGDNTPTKSSVNKSITETYKNLVF